MMPFLTVSATFVVCRAFVSLVLRATVFALSGDFRVCFRFLLTRGPFFFCVKLPLGCFLKFLPLSFPTRFTSSFNGAAVSDFMVSSCLLVISLERAMSIALSSVRDFSRKSFLFVPLSIIPITNLSRINSSVSVPNLQDDANFRRRVT